ncbi:hypothetical protein QUF75_01480 [Desulfococcaceae bacterium HSG7]|nr:hypothetical protein [Desulfococcaceae bacterium HSG7]
MFVENQFILSPSKPHRGGMFVIITGKIIFPCISITNMSPLQGYIAVYIKFTTNMPPRWDSIERTPPIEQINALKNFLMKYSSNNTQKNGFVPALCGNTPGTPFHFSNLCMNYQPNVIPEEPAVTPSFVESTPSQK